jgi:hypothetical protein
MIIKKSARKLSFIRFLLEIAVGIAIFVLLIKLFVVSNNTTAQYLAIHNCSNDQVLNKSFKTMNTFLTSLFVKNLISLLLVILIIALDFVVAFMNSYATFMKKRIKKQMKQRLAE